jgi:hypothetical protein
MTIAFVIMSMIAGLAIAAYILEVRVLTVETINVAAEDSNDNNNMIIRYLSPQEHAEQDEHIAAIEQGRDEETECYEAHVPHVGGGQGPLPLRDRHYCESATATSCGP